MRYILKGKEPVLENDLEKWAEEFSTTNRQVRLDNITVNGEKIMVSTVFLGMDHSFSGGPPLLFETMIFGGEHDQECNRYSTWEQAEEGHEQALKFLLEDVEQT